MERPSGLLTSGLEIQAPNGQSLAFKKGMSDAEEHVLQPSNNGYPRLVRACHSDEALFVAHGAHPTMSEASGSTHRGHPASIQSKIPVLGLPVRSRQRTLRPILTPHGMMPSS